MKTNARRSLCLLTAALITAALACSLLPQTTTDDQSQTQLALSVQQTVVARDIQQLTAEADAPPAPQDEQPPADPAQPPAQEPPSPAAGTISFEDWLQSEARILLYEDLYGTALGGWVGYALNGLGLDYDDTVSDISILEQQVDTSIEWDLIIYAREDREYQEGHIIQKLYNRLRGGSSLIIELWNLDEEYDDYASIASMFRECGITFQRDFDPDNQDEQVLYAHDSDHPIHTQPNDNIRMNYVLDTWQFDPFGGPGDYGDLVEIIPGGDAEILFGHSSNNDSVSGTVVVCFDDRLIIQTHGTHSYGENRSVPLWENYIYNALRARYEYLYGE
jgi:hypothetical protein